MPFWTSEAITHSTAVVCALHCKSFIHTEIIKTLHLIIPPMYPGIGPPRRNVVYAQFYQQHQWSAVALQSLYHPNHEQSEASAAPPPLEIEGAIKCCSVRVSKFWARSRRSTKKRVVSNFRWPVTGDKRGQSEITAKSQGQHEHPFIRSELALYI